MVFFLKCDQKKKTKKFETAFFFFAALYGCAVKFCWDLLHGWNDGFAWSEDVPTERLPFDQYRPEMGQVKPGGVHKDGVLCFAMQTPNNVNGRCFYY